MTATSTIPVGSVLGAEALMALMVRFGATRVRTAEGLEIHIPAPLATSAQSAATQSQNDACHCGHQQLEHSDAGCLLGCPHERCRPEPADAG